MTIRSRSNNNSSSPPLDDAREQSGPRSERIPGLHLTGLCSLAIAQPLFDLLGRHGEFFVSHDASGAEIVWFTLGLITLPPLVAIALLWVARRVSPHAERALDHALVAVLVAVTLLPPLLRAAVLPEVASYAAALAAGVVVAAASARFGGIRVAFRVLAIAPLIFAALFLGADDIRKLVLPAGADTSDDVRVSGNVPIVLVVFDELPLTSLLAADGEIDASLFPAFAEFAAGSTWYRGVSAVSSRTNLAMPAILTGRYPPLERKLPIRADHPDNLFSLLDDAYELNVIETETRLHGGSDRSETEHGGAVGLVTDVAILYAHLLSPSALRESLPAISATWAGFGDDAAATDEVTAASATRQRRARKRNRAAADVAAFERFIRSIHPLPGDDARVLHFLHVTLPHGDWQLLADGRSYLPNKRYGFVDGRWLDTPWWSTDAHRRHLLQLVYTDRLLGRLLERLHETGVYDPALVILTSDHGASFWPGGSFRKPAKIEHPEDLLSVPLFVKLPHQRTAAVDARFAESVDLLPTIADAVGAAVSWAVDGCSLFDADCPERTTRRLYTETVFRTPKLMQFEPDVIRSDATLRRKLALFGSDGRVTDLVHAGFGAGIVDQPVDSFPQPPGVAGTLRISETMKRVLTGRVPGRVPARIVGRLELAEASPNVARVAVAVDGIVRAVVPAPHDGVNGPRVAALLPADSIPASIDRVALYLVIETPGEISLHPLALR
jgi:hypothetical protein